jgi:hypothetical protein
VVADDGGGAGVSDHVDRQEIQEEYFSICLGRLVRERGGETQHLLTPWDQRTICRAQEQWRLRVDDRAIVGWGKAPPGDSLRIFHT